MSDNPQGFSYYGRTPNGVEMAITLSLEGIDTPNDIAEFCEQLDAALHAKKFTRSDRLDKPSYQGGGGGKQQRAETPAPAGIVHWQHCGVPARYVVYKKDGAKGHEGRGVPPGKADMWVCAKDKQCEDVTSGKSDRPAAHFDFPVEKGKPPANGRAPLADRVNDKPQGIGDFLNTALGELKYTRPQILKFAQLSGEELDALGPDGWADLLSKLRAEKKAADATPAA